MAINLDFEVPLPSYRASGLGNGFCRRGQGLICLTAYPAGAHKYAVYDDPGAGACCLRRNTVVVWYAGRRIPLGMVPPTGPRQSVNRQVNEQNGVAGRLADWLKSKPA